MIKNVFLILCNSILFAVAFTEAEHAKGIDKIFKYSFCCIFRIIIIFCISLRISNAHFKKHMLNLTKIIIVCSVVCFFFEILFLRFQFLKFISFLSAFLPIASLLLCREGSKERNEQRQVEI